MPSRLVQPGTSDDQSRPVETSELTTEARTVNKPAVLGLMRRKQRGTLAEIMETTGWQKHTVRGFVSLLCSKGKEKIESSKNAAWERTYR